MGKMFSVLRAMDDYARLVLRDQLAEARLPETAERQACEVPSCDYPAQYRCSQCGRDAGARESE